MGSAFAVEFTIPEAVRREQCVMFAWGSGDLLCHHAHRDCPIDHPHVVSECGHFKATPTPETTK